MKRKYSLVFLVLAVAVAIVGCSRQNASVPMPIAPDVIALDQQIADIKDQQSAEKAVGTFLDYVDSRLVRNQTAEHSVKTLGSRDLVKEIAAQELACRVTNKVTALSATEYPSVEGGYTDVPADYVPQVMPMSVDDLSIKVNAIAKEDNLYVEPQDVEKVKEQADQKMPHLSPDGSTFCTPLGALVTGYALVSGDDGTKPAGSVDIPSAKIDAFINAVVE